MAERCQHCGCARHSLLSFLWGAVWFKLAMALPGECVPKWFWRSYFWACAGNYIYDLRWCDHEQDAQP